VGTHAQFVPLQDPGSELHYQYLQRMKALTGPNRFSFQLAPYITNAQLNSVSDNPSGAFHWWPSRNNQLRLFMSPDESVVSDNSSTTNSNTISSVERFRGGASLRMSDKFGAYVSFLLDESLADDPTYSGKVWRNLAGYVESGVISYQNDKLTLLFGRFRSSWGPVLTNQLLSQEAYPLDGLSLRYRAGRRLSYSYKLARLDAFAPDRDPFAPVDPSQPEDIFVNRYLAAHRLDLHLRDNLRVGLFESVIFAGPGRGVELQYFNPLNFYHGAQLNEQGNDNTFLGFDFDWTLRGGANLYGQIVVDDFQIENEVPGDQEPNEFGALFGLYLADVIGQSGWDIDLRWEGVTNRTYNQKLERNRYLNHGQPLGHPIGNDFQRYQVKLRRWLGESGGSGLLTASTVLLRKGEGRISDLWSEPWLLSIGDYSEPFPTGIVERTIRYQLNYQRMFNGNSSPLGYLSASGGWQTVSNVAHSTAANQSNLFFNLRISLFFSTDWALD
jgi:hypothetical protein